MYFRPFNNFKFSQTAQFAFIYKIFFDAPAALLLFLFFFATTILFFFAMLSTAQLEI